MQLLRLQPAFISFAATATDGGGSRREQPPQIVTFENPSDSVVLTFKIEANCSTRYKVLPITGLLAPGAIEHVSFSLRAGETAKPAEDRFLVRCAVVEANDDDATASPRDFWALKKKQPDFVCDKQIIQVVPSSERRDDDEEEVYTADLHHEEHEHENAIAAAVDDDDDDDGEAAANEPLLSEYVQSIAQMAKRAEAQGNHALAAAWYEFMLPHVPTVQPDVDRNVARSDEFDLLVARDEVYKLQSQRQDLETSYTHQHAHPPPPPPPAYPKHPSSSAAHRLAQQQQQQQNARMQFNSPAPAAGQQLVLQRKVRHDAAASGGVPNFAAPTEASLAMRRTPASSAAVGASSASSSPTGSAATINRRLFPPSTPIAASATGSSAYKPFKPANLRYILDVFPMFSAAGATRLVLPSPELTVREMKDLLLHQLKLNREYEDLDLFVKDLVLSDHWRGTDFGLRAGITRLQMKRKRRTPAKPQQPHRQSVAKQPPQSRARTASTSSAASAVAAAEEEEEGHHPWETRCGELTQALQAMTVERDVLLKQLNEMGREYDSLASKVVELGRENDQLVIDKLELNQRLFVLSNQVDLPPPSLLRCFCVVAAPVLFGDCDTAISNPVHIAASSSSSSGEQERAFAFDSVNAHATPEYIVEQLPREWLSTATSGTGDRTLVLVGETLGGKSLLLEGFANQRGVYSLVCGRLLDLLAEEEEEEEAASLAISGFQTFQNGGVIDFLDQTEGQSLRVRSVDEFESALEALLQDKQMDEAGADVLQEGRPTQADSCVVLSFEVTTSSSHGGGRTMLRVVESCGVEVCERESDVLVGHIIKGEDVMVCCVLHPALNERTTALACSSARSIGLY